MAINNFKPFATAANANVTTQADWEALPALLSGFMAGKASSAQVNKAIRQASFIAAALAQYTANKSGQDVLDNGDLNGFITKMSAAFGKDFQALDATLTALAGLATGANKLPYFTGNDTAAQTDLTSVGRDIIGKSTIADILTYLGISLAKRIEGNDAYTGLVNPDGSAGISIFNDKTWGAFSGSTALPLAIAGGGLGATTPSGGRANLGLKTAAVRDVGTGANQIPDMGSFTFSGDANSWVATFANGLIVQGGVSSTINPPNTYDTMIQFRVPFPSRLLYIGEHDSDGGGYLTLWNFDTKTTSGCRCSAITRIAQGGTQLLPISASACLWIAVGV